MYGLEMIDWWNRYVFSLWQKSAMGGEWLNTRRQAVPEDGCSNRKRMSVDSS